MAEFSQRLKECRERMKKRNSKWTQGYVADKVGVARTTYTAYENGTKQPPIGTINALADLFEVTSDHLLGRDEKIKTKDNVLTEYQQTVLDWVTSREDFSFYESPEELIDMIEQFELMYERMRKKE